MTDERTRKLDEQRADAWADWQRTFTLDADVEPYSDTNPWFTASCQQCDWETNPIYYGHRLDELTTECEDHFATHWNRIPVH